MVEDCSIRQTSEKWGISVRWIQVLCAEKRIPGAIKIGYSWAIPTNAEKLGDARLKSGKYVKMVQGSIDVGGTAWQKKSNPFQKQVCCSPLCVLSVITKKLLLRTL